MHSPGLLSLRSSQAERWIVEEGGPLRARIRLEGWLGHSRVRWTLSLLRYEPRLFIELDVHFCDHLKLIQMPVHLAETPRTWRDGQAMGVVIGMRNGDQSHRWTLEEDFA